MGALKSRFVLGLFALLCATTGSASPVVYEFTALSVFPFLGGGLGSFTFTAPDFIASNLDVPAASLDACVVTSPPGGVCGTMQFFADSSSLESGSDDHDAIGFTVGATTAYYYFANGAFGAPGTYATVLFGSEQEGRLTVHGAAIPEPASLALLAIGFAGFGFARRRFAR